MTEIGKGEVFNTALNYPQVYQIELTEACNLKCPMCINDRIKNKQSIRMDLIDRIVAGGWLRNTTYVELQFSGEPTLSANLEYAIDRIHETGTMVGLSTNLTTVRYTWPILNKLDCLTISVDVYDKDYYEQSRAPEKFVDFENHLAIALLYIKNPLIQLQLLKTEWTKDIYDEAKEKFLKMLEKADWIEAKYIVREVEDCFVGYHENGELPVNNQMCLNPFITVSIKADGTVVPCCFDFFKDLPLGNAYEHDLLDIWHDNVEHPEIGQTGCGAITFLREAHQKQEGLPKKCKECYARSPVVFMNNEIIPTLIKHKIGNIKEN